MALNYDDYIESLINKDEAAFNIIYEHSNRSVYAVIISVVKSKSVTEDLMQDTYIKAITKIHQYKKNGKFLSWLCSIAHRNAIDYYRANKQLTTIDVSENEDLFETVSPNYEQRFLIEELLDKLDDISRQIVLLHIIGEQTFKEISSIVNKPLGTVLWLYNKAISTLKKEAL
ncbi:MAG: RNA polymerase sigma factor [Acholeplasmataceae bacterium]|nr:RNA polymerase sigma factor [Acholeplasmataceae bacterium]